MLGVPDLRLWTCRRPAFSSIWCHCRSTRFAGPEAVPVADEDHEWRPGGAQAISKSTSAPLRYLRTGEEM